MAAPFQTDVHGRRARRRPWWRPHLLTLVAGAALAAAFVRANMHNVDPYQGDNVSVNLKPPVGSYGPNARIESILGNLTLDLRGFSYGWPLRYREYWTLTVSPGVPSQGTPAVERHSVLESRRALWTNGLVGLVIVVCAAAAVETWLRSRNRMQFGLRTALVATAAVAVTLSVWRVRHGLETAFGQEQFLSRVFELPVWLYVPILAGLAVALFALLWLLLAALTWPFARIARRGS